MAKNTKRKKRHPWTDAEKQLLRELYPDRYAHEIAAMLGITAAQVYNQAAALGLSKSEAFKAMEQKRQGERLVISGQQQRFQKGHPSHNKGKSMPAHVRVKIAPTQFKPGQKPHNARPIGYERISKDGYPEVKVADGKFVAKHRLLWQQHHGPIPKGWNVVFRDRNPLNVTIENLELISRRENMQRNSIVRYPTELISTIKLVKKLKRAIDEKQN